MSSADKLETILRKTGSKVSWSRRTIRVPESGAIIPSDWTELSIQTRISEVTFIFDGADNLVRVETPEDADTNREREGALSFGDILLEDFGANMVGGLGASDPMEVDEMRTEARRSELEEVKAAILEAKKLITSQIAHRKLDLALERLG